MSNIKVWLGSLAAYNSGTLSGRWVTLPLEPEELNEEIDDILKVGGGEEIDVFDLDCSIDGIYSDISQLGLNKLNAVAQRFENLKEYQRDNFAIIIQVTDSIEEAFKVLEEERALILSNVEDEADLSIEHISEFSSLEIPKEIEPFFDHTAHGRYLTHSGWKLVGRPYNVAICID